MQSKFSPDLRRFIERIKYPQVAHFYDRIIENDASNFYADVNYAPRLYCKKDILLFGHLISALLINWPKSTIERRHCDSATSKGRNFGCDPWKVASC